MPLPGWASSCHWARKLAKLGCGTASTPARSAARVRRFAMVRTFERIQRTCSASSLSTTSVPSACSARSSRDTSVVASP